MPIPVQQFPILEAGQMNPFHQALQSGLDTYNKGLAAAYARPKLQSDIQRMQAEAASKMAYANLMGPQFLAKLMGNQDILANIPDDQKQKALELVLKSGGGQALGGSNIPVNNNPLLNSLKDVYTQKIQGEVNTPSQEQAQLPIQNQFSNVSPSLPLPQKEDVSTAIGAWLKSPEAQAQAQKEGVLNIPPNEQLMSWYNTQNPQSTGMASQPSSVSEQRPKSFAENVGDYQGVVEEGKESGKNRAKDIAELNDKVFSSKTNEATLNDLSDILASPTFEQIRQIPLAQQHELAYYAKFGTKEQQQMVGKYYTLTGNVIKDSARDFGGQFRVGEQQLLNGMKANPSDTIEVAKGKVEALSYLNKMLGERSRITSELMSKNHMNKLEASNLADKQVNGAVIRRQIQDRLNPKPTDSDISFMAQKYNISPEEVKKKLKSKGIL